MRASVLASTRRAFGRRFAAFGLTLCLSCSANQASSGVATETVYTPRGEATIADAGDLATDAGSAVSSAVVDSGTPVPVDAGYAGSAVVVDAGAPVVVADAGATTAAAVNTGPVSFPVVPMHLVPAPGATGGDARLDLELRADGTLYSHNQYVGQLAGARILGPHGAEILSIDPDGTVRIAGAVSHIRMQANGDVLLPNGATLTFAADGTPLSVAAGQPPRRGPSRLNGFRPEVRTTAGLMALIAATVALPSGR